MIEDGVLERTAPREIYALHCGSNPVGTFAVGPGQPGQDRFRIELAGPGAADDAKRLVAMIDGLSTVRAPADARTAPARARPPHFRGTRALFCQRQNSGRAGLDDH
ncbi:hypothetical protein ABZY05_42110 [Streptomyces canus]|uniref:hypothetical protein n=1 Tax=Streptomyces canus TaxID=58343 RepID=UPI0033B700E3